MGKRKSSAKAAPKKKAEPLCMSPTPRTPTQLYDIQMLVLPPREGRVGQAGQAGHVWNTALQSVRTTLLIAHQHETEVEADNALDLSAAVDVYCDWVDACEEIRLKQPPKQRAPKAPNPLEHGFGGGANLNLHSNDVDDDVEGEADEDADADANADADEDDERESRRPGFSATIQSQLDSPHHLDAKGQGRGEDRDASFSTYRILNDPISRLGQLDALLHTVQNPWVFSRHPQSSS
ncbi:hypothetical protein EHS25_006638 [Saitozyma podzolica]|uniref:Uncharacterized protein n=1 Tax=Saitozyma podzolica TaxID=1890683 RepID=A0A427YSM0_9TREE|nr:hypothetical protein EHS25_006638 [Saitozyma podzolica]